MIITQTPLRISIAGGGTDFREFFMKEGGAVLSMAIDKYVYIIVKERFDDMIYLNYSRREIVDCVDEIQHGLIREAMRKTGVKKGIEITALADIPSEGSGLGSSSSFTVGLLNALYTYQGVLVTAERLAREACEIEIDIVKEPIGVQDQYIAAYGDLRFFEFQKSGKVKIEKLEVSTSEKMNMCSNLLLFFTNSTRRASHVLTEQKTNIGKRMDELRRLKKLSYRAKDSVLNNSFDNIGYILHDSWEIKKKLAPNVSNSEIDEYYDRALKAGAIGGKIAGAGGGGFLLLYCQLHKQAALKRELNNLVELPFMIEKDGSKVIFNYRRYKWK